MSLQSLVNIVNEQQSQYKAYDLINKDCPGNNIVFYGIKKIDDQNQEQQDDQTIIRSQSTEIYALKLLNISFSGFEKFSRIHNILHLFINDPRVLQNENVHEINTYFNKYLLVPTKYYPLKDLYEYIYHTHGSNIEKGEIIRFATFQALHILILFRTFHVVHNDFKFENLLVTEDQILIQPTLPFNIVAFDFDEAEVVPEDGKAEIIAGTKLFNSPEVQRGLPHDYSSDLWSLGINIFLFTCGYFPFDIGENDSRDEIYEKQCNNELICGEGMSAEVFECVSNMLRFNPEERITPEAALRLNWFNGLDAVVPRRVEAIDTNAEIGNETQ